MSIDRSNINKRLQWHSSVHASAIAPGPTLLARFSGFALVWCFSLLVSLRSHPACGQPAATFPSQYPVQKMGHGYADRDPGTGNPRVNLDDLKELSVAKARELGTLHYLEVSLRGLKRLSPEAARAMLANRKVHVLDISGVEQMPVELAAELEPFQWNLYLDGVKSISPAAVRQLAARKRYGWVGLNGLTEVSPELASELVKLDGNLYLEGVATITPDTARGFAGKGGNLIGIGLTTLSPDVAEALAECRCDLYLSRLKTISKKAAKALSKKSGAPLTLALDVLPADVAAALAKCKCELRLPNLKTLDLASARAIAELDTGTNESWVLLWSDRPKRILGIPQVTQDVHDVLKQHVPIELPNLSK